MPIKEYQCMDDGERLNVSVRVDEHTAPPFCPKCGNRMVWAPTSMTFALKGLGWTGKSK